MKALLLKHQHSFTIYIFILHCFCQISVSLIHILFGTSVTFLENQLSCDLPPFFAELWARPWAGSEFGVFKCLSGDVGCAAGIRRKLSFSAVRIRFYRHLLRSIEIMIFFKEFYLNVLTDVLECT